jgi:N-acetylneuraminic acid mutarotase
MKTKLLFTAWIVAASLNGYSQWVAKANVPIMAGQEIAVAHPNGNIYIIGSYNLAPPTDSVMVYNQASNTWSHGTPLPYKTRGAAACLGNDSLIYVFGGYNGSDMDSAYKYNTKTKVWTKLKNMPSGSWYGAAATAPTTGNIIVFGGENSLNLVQIYNTTLNSWSSGTNIPVGVEAPGAVTASNGKMYVIGGLAGTVIDSVQVYDPVLNSWSRGKPMPTKRLQFGYAVDENGKINCVGGKQFGGNNGKPFFNVYEIYDPVTDTWSTGPILPHGLGECTAACINFGINVFGGCDSATGYDSWNYRLAIAGNSVATITGNEGFKVYPNPAVGEVTIWISANGEENATIRISDMMGHICYTQNITVSNKTLKTIDMSSFSKGVYFIQYTTSKSNLVKKLVLQ